MSLMLKLLPIILVLNSILYADTISEKVEDFLVEQLSQNSTVKSVDSSVSSIVPLKELAGWNAYIMNVEAVLKAQPDNIIKQKMIFFSNGTVITKELIDIQSGESFTEMVKPDFLSKYYTKANLIYGNENAKHKIAIFSDPLCPFCKAFVPSALQEMKKDKDKFAIYYYHFPLVRIHPASVALVEAAVAAELKGVKDVVLKLYNVTVNPNEKDLNKILEEFNKAVGTHITIEDLKLPAVSKQVQFDLDVATDMMVGGTPTLYIDGKIDKTKEKYKKVQ